MILCLLAPDCGMISKGKQDQWRYIEEFLSPILSQAAVNAKAEEDLQRLATIAGELATLVQQEQEQDPEDAIENTADDRPEQNDEEPAGQPDAGLIPTA